MFLRMFRKQWQDLQWIRIGELTHNSAVVFGDNIEPNDIKQGSLGDCYYMSALAVLTMRQQDLQKCLVTKNYNEL